MTTMCERFMKIGDGSVRFISTREDVLNFIEQEIKLAVKEERERIVGFAKNGIENCDGDYSYQLACQEIIEYLTEVEE